MGCECHVMRTEGTLEFGLAENIYGHVKRLEWIASQLKPSDRVLEIGCGTGFMLTLPLLRAGWDAIGVDTDRASIEYGQRLLAAEGLDPARLSTVNAADLEGPFDGVILSEVLEHVPSDGIAELLHLASTLLSSEGRLFVTVPNGYGVFEVESFLWGQVGLGWLVERSRLSGLIRRIKLATVGGCLEYEHPSSLDCSPHIQRFTLGRLTRLLESNGFDIERRSATVLVAGPFSNLLFTGYRTATRFNRWCGDAFPALGASFMMSAVVSAQPGRQDQETPR